MLQVAVILTATICAVATICVIAACLVLNVCWKIIWDVYVFILAPRIGRGANLKESGGKWAAVTGAGAGIGRGYSLALARRGVNVCLIGRSEKSLAAVAKICEEKFNVKTKVVVHDFANIQANDGEVMKEALKDILAEIGILINNVGIMGGEENFVTPFINNKPNPVDYGRNMVNVNIQSVILMTGLLLPLFVQRNKGIIVNVGSSAGFKPVTGGAIYSSTKAFVAFFTEALRQEISLKSASNVIVQTVTPFSVRTGLIPKRAFELLPSVLAPEPDQYAMSAVQSIGYQPITCGCFSHNIQGHLLGLIDSLLPSSITSWIRYTSMVKFKSSPSENELSSKKQR